MAMQASSSAGSLLPDKAVNFHKPRSLILPRGCQRSWSSPALAGAFALRKYAVITKHIAGQRAPRHCEVMAEQPMEQIDLIGGNGNWRMKKAQVEFKIKDEIALEEKRQEHIKEQRKKVRAAELVERARRQHEA